MYELFSIREMVVLLTSANGACVKKLGKRNRKEKVLETVMKYWSRLLEKDETNPLWKTINSKKTRGTNWMSRINRNWKGWAWGISGKMEGITIRKSG